MPGTVILRIVFELFLEIGDKAICQFTGTGKVPVPLCAGQFHTRRIEVFLHLLRTRQFFLFGLPDQRQRS